MGKYQNVSESMLRKPNGDLLAKPGETFTYPYPPMQEQTLAAAGAIRVLERTAVIETESTVPTMAAAAPPPGPGETVGPAPDPDLVMVTLPPAGPGDFPRGPGPGVIRRTQRSITGPVPSAPQPIVAVDEKVTQVKVQDDHERIG